MGHLWAMLKLSWGHLGMSGRILEASVRILGHLESILEASWGHLGASWRHLGAYWRHLGASWRHLGSILGASWSILGDLGAILGPSWGILEPSWGHLEGFGRHLGASWEHLVAILKPYAKNIEKSLIFIVFSMVFEPPPAARNLEREKTESSGFLFAAVASVGQCTRKPCASGGILDMHLRRCLLHVA